MKHIIILAIISLFLFSIGTAQEKVVVFNKTGVFTNTEIHIRAKKGDKLRINLQTAVKNEKKGKYYSLDTLRIYRQFAEHSFQYIVEKYKVSSVKDLDISVPSDGIYTLIIKDYSMKKFDTNLKIERIPQDAGSAIITRKAVLVEIPDTAHLYTKYADVYDSIRIMTPTLRKQQTEPFYEDQIFIDKAHALRIGNAYTIPVIIPKSLQTSYKTEESASWGFYITVSNAIYAALKGKVADVASAGIGKGVGKMMSGKTDAVTGTVSKNKTQKAYEVFDKASEINAYAEISGDISEQAHVESAEKGSETVAVITGFTGLSDLAGGKIADFVTPKASDKIRYKLFTDPEYRKYIVKQPATPIMKGTGSYFKADFPVKNENDIFYLVIENERDGGGGIVDGILDVGKSVLSEYVYASVKVYVKRKTTVTYDKGIYETTYTHLTNPAWLHEELESKSTHVIFEDQMKPYYKVIPTKNIY